MPINPMTPEQQAEFNKLAAEELKAALLARYGSEEEIVRAAERLKGATDADWEDAIRRGLDKFSLKGGDET